MHDCSFFNAISYLFQEKILEEIEREKMRTPARVTFQDPVNISHHPQVQTARPALVPSVPNILTSRSDSAADGLQKNSLLSEIEGLGNHLQTLSIEDHDVSPIPNAVDILVVNPAQVEPAGLQTNKADKTAQRGRRVIKYEVTEAKNFAKPKAKRALSPTKQNDDGSESMLPKPRPCVFPAECRTTFTMRRFMDEKADKLIREWSPENKRKREVKRILARISFPTIVERQKTTSAIFRDYRQMGEKGRPKEGHTKDRVRLTQTRGVALRLPVMSCDEKVGLLNKPGDDVIQRSKTLA